MIKKIWRSIRGQEGVGDIPGALRRQLFARHYLENKEDSDLLCYAYKRTRVAGRWITFFKIFNPALLKDTDIKAWRYEQLDDHPSVVLYEGSWQEGHLADISDLRKVKSKSPVRSKAA